MIRLECGDFRELIRAVPNGEVDFLLTDPPYPKRYWPLISDLGSEALRVLKPDGFLVVYSGHYCVPEWSWRLMRAGFRYRWIGWLRHTRAGVRPEIRMRPMGKPILFFAKHWKAKPLRTIDDTIVGGGMDKRFHPWQQDLPSARYLIEAFTNPGDLILDPFAGAGTVLAAALRLQRLALGFEIDRLHYLNGCDRLDEEEAALGRTPRRRGCSAIS
jgi:site-specific DNA-methyltransferase (adenine-specific)